MIRERFSGDLKEAIKARDAQRVSTLRLICAAVKDRDIRTHILGEIEAARERDLRTTLWQPGGIDRADR